MSSTPSSPKSSPSVALSPSANSPPSKSSSPPPSPSPTSNSTAPPPTPSPPPRDPPPPPKPAPSETPPPSNSEPPPPTGKTPPSSPPPTPPAPPPSPSNPAPPNPDAPPPADTSPPSVPNNPPSRPSLSPPPEPGGPRPSPPAVRPPSPIPPAQTVPSPSPPASPGQSLPAPLLPPPQSNTPVPTNPTTPSGPSTPTENPPADSTPSSPNNNTVSTTKGAGDLPVPGLIAIVLVGVLALSLVVFAVWFTLRRKKKKSGLHHGYMAPQNPATGSARKSRYHSAHPNGSSATKNSPYRGDHGGIGNSKSSFTYEELVGATNGFSEDNLLGEGGFGCVYKGNLADGREIAVKQLKIGGGQGEREFRAEVEIISRIHHRHLVSLVGYCISDLQRLLVYDYVPNNTLYYHLHGNVPVMTWNTRFKVASGAAHGIAYLHEDCTPRIIHRDIKSANILLDNNFEAKVADFGLAKLVLDLDAHTHVSTRVMGTFGYMAPEYATTGKLTEKSDVFSFGVVLLELITGRKSVDSSRPLDDESLVEWARPLLTQALEDGSFENLIDPRLENNYHKTEMVRLTEAAAACVRHSASKRPKMSQVVRALDSISQMSDDLTNGMKPGNSQIYDSQEQSAEIRRFRRMAFGSQQYNSDSNSDSSFGGS